MNILPRFIIIDDDEFNNKICTITIRKMSKDADIISFTDPVAGFNYMVSEYSKPTSDTAILFLDINMPVMNGWEFLDRFDLLDVKLKSQIKIHILSSSVDKRDIERAKVNKNVVNYLVKPLTGENIKSVALFTKQGK